MNPNNSEESSQRIVNLDFLRGFFIILALEQHFTYYINMWYVEYFGDAIALKTTYNVHLPMIGQQVPTDIFNYFMAVVFTPWVSQIYLTMATFNLAKRSPADFAANLPAKLKIFGLIFVYFVAENLIVAPNFGQGISFYPIMLWMVIMALISCIYAYAGISGVLGLALLSCLRFVVPLDVVSDFFQAYVIQNFHPDFEYDARPEYFILSGCLGFFMGHVHYHKKTYAYKKDSMFAALGMFLVGLYIFFGDTFTVDVRDVLSTEHDFAKTFTGTAYVIGVQAMVMSGFLWLERKKIQLNVPIISWVGRHSLMIFGLHRILFIRIIAPFAVFLGSMFGYTLGASVLEVYSYIGITLMLCYFVKATKMASLILQQKV